MLKRHPDNDERGGNYTSEKRNEVGIEHWAPQIKRKGAEKILVHVVGG
jgi:hypothetical protein